MSAQAVPTTAEQIFILVKSLPPEQQEIVLSEIKKLELLQRARQADASVRKAPKPLSEADILRECDIVRKRHYEQGRHQVRH